MFDYWKVKKAYNTLEVKYETLKKELEYKNRIITRQKNAIKKLKEERKSGNNKNKESWRKENI